jgi:hypothetical protein
MTEDAVIVLTWVGFSGILERFPPMTATRIGRGFVKNLLGVQGVLDLRVHCVDWGDPAVTVSARADGLSCTLVTRLIQTDFHVVPHSCRTHSWRR